MLHTPIIISYEPNRTTALSDAMFAHFAAAVFNLAVQQIFQHLLYAIYQFHPVTVLSPLAVSGRQVVDYGVNNGH